MKSCKNVRYLSFNKITLLFYASFYFKLKNIYQLKRPDIEYQTFTMQGNAFMSNMDVV